MPILHTFFPSPQENHPIRNNNNAGLHRKHNMHCPVYRLSSVCQHYFRFFFFFWNIRFWPENSVFFRCRNQKKIAMTTGGSSFWSLLWIWRGADDELFVGVDVHKKSYHVAMFLNDTPAIDFNMTAKSQKLIKKLKPVMARKLSGHMWAMLMKNQPYDPKKTKSKII